MPINAPRTLAKFLSVVALLLASASCGTSPRQVICGLPSTGANCTCGEATAACPVNPGPEFLYATSTGGQILAFSIDHGSGALTALAPVPGPSMSLGIAAVNNQFLYASDLSTGQLYGFSVDQTTGALSALGSSPFSAGSFSAGLAAPEGSSVLYTGGVGVDAFTITTSGAPTPISGSSAGSGADLFAAIDPSGKFLYASDDSPPGGIFAYTIASTGALTPVQGSPFPIPGQTVANSRPLGIVDTGSFVFAALADTNQVAAFSIVSGTGALTPVPNSPFATGSTPVTVVFASGFLYVLCGGQVYGYSIDSTTEALTPLSDSPFAIVGGSMATDFFGQYLYVSGTGIQGFTINSTSGALTPLSSSPFPASGVLLMAVVQIPPP
jgi:hypothetical protein